MPSAHPLGVRHSLRNEVRLLEAADEYRTRVLPYVPRASNGVLQYRFLQFCMSPAVQQRGSGVTPRLWRTTPPAAHTPPPSNPASGHPGAQKPLLVRAPPPPVRSVHLDAPGQQRGQLPSSVWARHRAVKQGQSGGFVGTTYQGKGRVSRGARIGQAGRGRAQGRGQ